MRFISRPFIFAAALMAGAAGVTAGVFAASETEGDKAQALVFDAPYIEKLKAPSKLIYSFDFKSADKDRFGADFSDQIAVNILPGENGSKNLTFDLFSGDRKRTVGPVSNASANAASMIFMEWDLSRMKMLIKGNASYFRNRVRQAFRDKSKIEDVKISFEGREVPATRITLKPYLGDPNARDMQIFQAKVYEFTMSDDVPGGIYQIRIYVPAAEGQGPVKTFVDEKMTFARYEPAEAK